jgi:hypothetical protein
MHGNAQTVVFYVAANFFQRALKVHLPVYGADGVRSEGHQIRAHPEEKQVVRHVVFQDLLEAGEVSGSGFQQPFLRKRSQPEGGRRSAGKRLVDAGISDFHKAKTREIF